MIITIDGPCASGKSTIARLIALHTGIYYVSSGYIYRAVAYGLSKDHGYTRETIHAPDATIVHDVISRIAYAYHNGAEHVTYDNVDVTTLLKNSAIDPLASIVSANEHVRELVNTCIRNIAKKHSLVIDGRDCGSVIFPGADYKYYVSASLPERARRWCVMQKKLGNMYDGAQCELLVHERDTRDMSRATAPLIVPRGACVIDATDFSAQQVADVILQQIKV